MPVRACCFGRSAPSPNAGSLSLLLMIIKLVCVCVELITPYIGKYDGSSIFLNTGKYGPYLNYKDKLYSVPKCFQTPKFGLKESISIIDLKTNGQKTKIMS